MLEWVYHLAQFHLDSLNFFFFYLHVLSFEFFYTIINAGINSNLTFTIVDGVSLPIVWAVAWETSTLLSEIFGGGKFRSSQKLRNFCIFAKLNFAVHILEKISREFNFAVEWKFRFSILIENTFMKWKERNWEFTSSSDNRCWIRPSSIWSILLSSCSTDGSLTIGSISAHGSNGSKQVSEFFSAFVIPPAHQPLEITCSPSGVVMWL